MSATRLLLVSLVLIARLTADGHVLAQAPAGAGAVGDITTAPVVLDGTVLFRVRGVSSFPAEERARLIRERIVAVAADSTIPVDSLRIVESEGVSRIQADDRPLLTVVDADAALEQVTRADLAGVHLIRVRQAIADYRSARSGSALWRGAVNSLAATLATAITIVVLVWFWRWMDRFLMRRLHARIQSVEIKSFEVMRAEQIWGVLWSALLTIRTVIILSIALVYLGFLLSQFPWTREVSQNMATFAIGPLAVIGSGIIRNIPGLVFLTVLFLVVRVALRLIRLFFDGVERGAVKLGTFYPDWAQPTYKLVRVGVIAFALIVAYPYIPGSESAAFRGISLFLGVLLSLGSSSAVSNIIAGYMMTYRRAFKVGDRIKVGDAVGDVIETRLQVTHLQSVKNEELIIPNSQILAGEVLNYSSLAREQGLILHTEVGIGYETPWRQVEAMLLMAAERTPGVSTEPRPFILEKKLGDFAVTYELNVYCTNVTAMAHLYAELHRNILDVFNEYGIQIMTPAYEGDPAQPKIVPRKDWYAAPATPRAAPAETDRSVAS